MTIRAFSGTVLFWTSIPVFSIKFYTNYRERPSLIELNRKEKYRVKVDIKL